MKRFSVWHKNHKTKPSMSIKDYLYKSRKGIVNFDKEISFIPFASKE